MKRIAILAIGTAMLITEPLHAQVENRKRIDLAITESLPESNARIENLYIDDKLTLGIKVKNNGPDKVEIGDVLIYKISGEILGVATILTATLDSTELDVGEELDLIKEFSQGSVIGTFEDGQPITVNCPQNTTVRATMLSIYGYNENGLFLDNGVDPYDTVMIEDGNNMVYIRNVTFYGRDGGDGGGNSIHENDLSRGIHVFPNPAKDYIIIQRDDHNWETTKIKIYDMVGRVVLQKELADQSFSDQVTLPLTNIPSGNYWGIMECKRGVTSKVKFSITK